MTNILIGLGAVMFMVTCVFTLGMFYIRVERRRAEGKARLARASSADTPQRAV